MSHLAFLSLCPSAGMNPGVSGKPRQWWTWIAPCQNCLQMISYRKGIFCTNVLPSRGNWKPCHEAWCGSYYTPLEGDRFLVRLPKDEEGNVLVSEEDKFRFGEVRPGDHLFYPFLCEICRFRNIQGRSPIMGKVLLGDTELMKCLRRVNLDAFWI
jgi:hypothetical protein